MLSRCHREQCPPPAGRPLSPPRSPVASGAGTGNLCWRRDTTGSIPRGGGGGGGGREVRDAGICSPGSYRSLQGRAGEIKESSVPRRADPMGGELGCWVGEGRGSQGRDKRGLLVTYNLCLFNQSQGEGKIGLAAPRAIQSKNMARDPWPDFYF